MDPGLQLSAGLLFIIDPSTILDWLTSDQNTWLLSRPIQPCLAKCLVVASMDLDNPRMPQLRVKMKTPAPRLRIATWPEIDALTQAADTMYLTSISMAVLLSLFQGQRETDIPISRADQFRQQSFIDPVSRKQVTDWTWRLNRSKRGTLGVMRLHPVLSERMPTMLSGLSPEDLRCP